MNQEILTLRTESPELKQVLLTGQVFRHGETWRGLPREAIWKDHHLESIIFEISPMSGGGPRLASLLWESIRPANLTLTLTPCAAIWAYGLYSGWEYDGWRAVLAVLGVLFLQIAVNAFNDVEDHLRMVDLPRGDRKSSVIEKGWISAQNHRYLAVLFLGLGILCGFPVVFQGGQALLWIGAAAALGVLTHSNRPFGIKYRTFGDLSILLLMGPFLTLGYSQAVFGQSDGVTWGLGFFFGFQAWATFLTKQLQCFELDRIRHASTLAQYLGFKKSRHLLAGFYGISFFTAWAVFLTRGSGSAPFSDALVLSLMLSLSLPVIIQFLIQVYKASGPVSALLTPLRLMALRIHFLSGIGLCSAAGVLYLFKVLF